MAIAAGLEQGLSLDRSTYKKLVVSRPVQPLGKDIGFLPGTLEEKMSPWLMPIQDNLEFLMGDKTGLQTYVQSGVFVSSTTNAVGCDSIITLYLTINYPDTSYNSITACDSILWNGNVYSTSGIYQYNTTTTDGCDSVAILDLTINYSSTPITLNQTVCDSFISFSHS